MTPHRRTATMTHAFLIGAAALLVLISSVALGLYLGTQTQKQFKEVEDSWGQYADNVDQKGVLISSIRGYLGYGGIIHSFKNYVLRGEPRFYERTNHQIKEFYITLAQYLAETLTAEERHALSEVRKSIAEYEKNLPIVADLRDKGLTINEIDQLVIVDDNAAIKALAVLESVWQQSRTVSSNRVFSAVKAGQHLIWVGFATIGALVLAALIIGYLFSMLLMDLRAAIRQLSEELKLRLELENSESRLARVVEQSPAIIFITDTDARILYVNQRFSEVTGWQQPEIEGKTPKFLQSGDTPTEVYDQIKDSLKQGKEWHGMFRNRRKSGGSYWVESSILPLIGPDGNTQNFIGIGEDITEKRTALEQVARAQKMEAVGLIAGGIAHDFNNILTTIIGAAHLAKLDVSDNEDVVREIDQINIAARRAQSLVKGLLTFARREPSKPTPQNLYSIVLEVIRLLRASVPPTIELIEPANYKDKLVVMADPNQLHQIILNLGRNAAEAIGSNPGRIEFSCKRLEKEPEDLPKQDAGWIEFSIKDSGPGMSAQTLEKLYDPFFTTKPIGKGTGLGMTVVSGLVEEMGGRISVESKLGDGSCFAVIFPGADKEVQVDDLTSGLLQTGYEKLMLVDDQPEVAATLQRVISRLGYSVDAFTSPITALEKISSNPDLYDLVITDMVMPDLNGEEFINCIRDIREDLPAIICSAYNPKQISVTGETPIIMSKPLDPSTVANTIRSVLDQRSAVNVT